MSRSVEGPIHRTNYREIGVRARKVAEALNRLGIKPGDRVATLAWNTWRHLESWYGIAGIGAVYHTLNPRLFPDQLVYIANHAEDKVLFFDITFADLVAQIAPKLKNVELYVAMTDAAHLPKANIPNLVAYEEFIAGCSGTFEWKEVDEKTACGLCYTSGTTGNPKGVLYSHRSNVLHALMAAQTRCAGHLEPRHDPARRADVPRQCLGAGLCRADGRRQAGACRDRSWTGRRSANCSTDEKVTMTAAVPTVWLALLQYLEQTGKTLPHHEARR